LAFELVLPSGEVVKCSKVISTMMLTSELITFLQDDNPDLFYSVPWSYGTLGFLTSVELQIVHAERWDAGNFCKIVNFVKI
jgi:delta24-sterol reductase